MSEISDKIETIRTNLFCFQQRDNIQINRANFLDILNTLKFRAIQFFLPIGIVSDVCRAYNNNTRHLSGAFIQILNVVNQAWPRGHHRYQLMFDVIFQRNVEDFDFHITAQQQKSFQIKSKICPVSTLFRRNRAPFFPPPNETFSLVIIFYL